MSKRIEEIFENVKKAETFIDVGCDHGYVAELMLKRGKCENAIITDISKPSLQKAETLLKKEIKNGKVKSFVANGLNGVLYNECASVLIAGMGGEEIVKILTNAPILPLHLTLQPMKNAEKVRLFLVNNGYKILKDYLFYDGKYYVLISATKGEDSLTADEIEFGRTNLNDKSQDFIRFINEEIEKVNGYLQNGSLTKSSELALKTRLGKLKGIIE